MSAIPHTGQENSSTAKPILVSFLLRTRHVTLPDVSQRFRSLAGQMRGTSPLIC
jgi:hypothetical protein